ncbi:MULTISPECIES: hypothetical protein [Pectobacterium]|uniref:Uncharacterized protein n=1 Tax=Pectobacterium aquaticum TaxID=2204145 RepID=A0ABX9Z5J7_9GAMM|nr:MULTISPECIES: hypothetical protein [Pectobacterium]RRN97152.1 hypothetical protein DMB79_009755 [Pectobacterium aquaticum]RRO03820.1 hypothetical protein DMB81_018185 [Pectobacterium aquaticum]RRO04489.1 hypothetical protein DMB83_003015 [Pectobacterium aquaticum]RRO10213.1 hypothetical protein DMB85_006570 [Pectobacterium aquaticum]URG53686.1 hypothetical protein IG605_005000 [Pectobacterium quasiaquaticum]
MKHNPEIWLQAADDAAESFLSQSVADLKSDAGYDAVSVLSTLHGISDAVYYLNEPLYHFIKHHTQQWFLGGMSQHPSFLTAWQHENIPSDISASLNIG